MQKKTNSSLRSSIQSNFLSIINLNRKFNRVSKRVMIFAIIIVTMAETCPRSLTKNNYH